MDAQSPKPPIDWRTSFDVALGFVLEREGGYQCDHDDPGNWTGGKVGAGDLRGTKYGISAKAYPNLDIATLTQWQARTIYEKDYWFNAFCDRLPGPLAVLAFDAAVNQGSHVAIMATQRAAGVDIDGVFGTRTHNAIQRCWAADPLQLIIRFAAARGWHYANTTERLEELYAFGWMDRLFRCFHFSTQLINH